MKSLVSVFAFASLLAVLAVPERAQACSCADDTEIRPKAGDEVATNSRVWLVGNCFGAAPTLSDASGTAVGFDASALAPRLTMLTPREELTLGESYIASCGGFVESSFTVTVEADDAAPALPSASIAEIEDSGGGLGSDSCGESEYARMDVAADRLTILVADIDGQATLDANLAGAVSDGWSKHDFVIVGRAPCVASNWDHEDGTPMVRWGSLDLAGNFSGWTDGEEVSTGCSCSLPGGTSPSHGLFLAAGLALAVLARRRR